MSSKYDCLKLNNQICFPLYACSKEIIKRYKPFLDKVDLTYTQYITMMALWENESMNVRELGNCLFLDSGTLTPLLKKLENKGYIKRSRSKEDERNLIVTLTDKGWDLREEMLSIPRSMDAMKQALVQDGWAVVCNPNPEDRLYLRPEAGDRNDSLGKYYNGTPVQVLETKGDWFHVRICVNGPEGWMMKKFLAFGDRMNDVEPAWPNLCLREEYADQTA